MTHDPILLECPNCLSAKDWYRATEPAPGSCPKCKSKRPWNVVKSRRVRPKGFVRVYSYKGGQELTGPDFQEDPNAWVK